MSDKKKQGDKSTRSKSPEPPKLEGRPSSREPRSPKEQGYVDPYEGLEEEHPDEIGSEFDDEDDENDEEDDDYDYSDEDDHNKGLYIDLYKELKTQIKKFGEKTKNSQQIDLSCNTEIKEMKEAISSKEPHIISKYFEELNDRIKQSKSQPSLFEQLKQYKNQNNETLQDILLQFNLGDYIRKMKAKGNISESILDSLTPLREFSKMFKFGVDERAVYFAKVQERLNRSIYSSDNLSPEQRNRNQILQETLKVYKNMYSLDGIMKDDWYQRYMKRIIEEVPIEVKKEGKIIKKSQVLAVQDNTDMQISGKILDRKSRLRTRLSATNPGVKYFSEHKSELPTSVLLGKNGNVVVSFRGGRGRQSKDFVFGQGNYGDMIGGCSPLFDIFVAIKKETRDRWHVKRGELSDRVNARLAPRTSLERFADESDEKDWNEEADLTIKLEQAVDKSETSKRLNINALPRRLRPLLNKKYHKEYTIQHFQSGTELGKQIMSDDEMLDMDDDDRKLLKGIFLKYKKNIISKHQGGKLEAKKIIKSFELKSIPGKIETALNYFPLEQQLRKTPRQASEQSTENVSKEEYEFLQKAQETYRIISAYNAWITNKLKQSKFGEKNVFKLLQREFKSRSYFGKIALILDDDKFKKTLTKNKSKLLQAQLEKMALKNLNRTVGVSQCIQSLHNYRRYVHGDIKPKNMMEDFKNGTYKLIDFGTTKKLDSEGRGKEIDTLTAATANFIPPEFMFKIPEKDEQDKKNEKDCIIRQAYTTKKSDVYQMASMCFGYSNVKAFARINLERFLFDPWVLGLTSNFWTVNYKFNLSLEEKRQVKAAIIDIITGGIQVEYNDSNSSVKIKIKPDSITSKSKGFLSKWFEKSNILHKPTSNDELQRRLKQIRRHAASITKVNKKNILQVTCNSMLDSRSSKPWDVETFPTITIGEEEYIRTPYSDDEGSGLELYEQLRTLSKLDEKYKSLFERVEDLFKSSMTANLQDRISSEEFNKRIAIIYNDFDVVLHPNSEMAIFYRKREEVEKSLDSFADKEALIKKLKEELQSKEKTFFQKLLEQVEDDRNKRLTNNIVAKLDINDIASLLSEKGSIYDFIMELINNEKFEFAKIILSRLLNLDQGKHIITDEQLKTMIYVAARKGNFEFILSLQEKRRELNWNDMILKEINSINPEEKQTQSILDFCISQQDIKSFKAFIEILPQSYLTDNRYLLINLITDIGKQTTTRDFIDIVISKIRQNNDKNLENWSNIEWFVFKFLQQEEINSCLSGFFIKNPEVSLEIIKFYKDMFVTRKQDLFNGNPSLAMFTFMYDHAEGIKEIIDIVFPAGRTNVFSLKNKQIELLKYTYPDNKELTYLDCIVANKNAAILQLVLKRFPQVREELFKHLEQEDVAERSRNILLNIIRFSEHSTYNQDYKMFNICIGEIDKDLADKGKFYEKHLGIEIFKEAVALKKWPIVCKLYEQYQSYNVELVDKLFEEICSKEVNLKNFLDAYPLHGLIQQEQIGIDIVKRLLLQVKDDTEKMDIVVENLMQLYDGKSFFGHCLENNCIEVFKWLLANENKTLDTETHIRVLLHNSDYSNNFIHDLMSYGWGDSEALNVREYWKPKKLLFDIYKALDFKPLEQIVLLLKMIEKTNTDTSFNVSGLSSVLQEKLKESIANLRKPENIVKYYDFYGKEEFKAILTEHGNFALPDRQKEEAFYKKLSSLPEKLQKLRLDKVAKEYLGNIVEIEGIENSDFLSKLNAWRLKSNEDVKMITANGKAIKYVKKIIRRLMIDKENDKRARHVVKGWVDKSIPAILDEIKQEKSKLIAISAGEGILSIFKEVKEYESKGAEEDTKFFQEKSQKYATNHNKHANNVIDNTKADDPLREIMFSVIESGLQYDSAIVRDLSALEAVFRSLLR